MNQPEPTDPGARGYRDAFALLAQLTRDFAATSDVAVTLERALESIAEVVGAEAGSLWLLEPEQERLACRASVGPHPITGLTLPVSEGVVGKAVRENVCERVEDVRRDPNFSQRMDDASGLRTRSLLCAPLRFEDEPIGAVELINKSHESGHFSESDAHLLQVLASSAGLAIANARLASARLENERVRRELELAAEIQRSLLPTPRPAPFPLHGVNLPARTVSGDFFDILPLAGRRIGFCLGDVSGKGMNAALLMAKTASLYRCLAKDLDGPGALLTRLNDEVCETSTRGMFVTMVAGVYDAARGTLCLANAGHEPPLFRARDGALRTFPAEEPPLGIVPGTGFPEAELELRGGAFYVCSDGLTETRIGDEALGAEGFQRLVERFAGKPLTERIEAIAAAVAEGELRDDLTLLGLSDDERAA